MTDGSFIEGATPGQHGFYRMNGGQVRALTKESSGKFFGPQYDRFGSDKGKRTVCTVYMQSEKTSYSNINSRQSLLNVLQPIL